MAVLPAARIEPGLLGPARASIKSARNVVANAELVRLGVVSHLLDGTFFVLLAMTLYILLRHVHQSVARAMVILEHSRPASSASARSSSLRACG